MFATDIHGVTKVEKIRVERFDPGAGITNDSSGYVTITLRSGRHAETTKFTFFADDITSVWETFGNAMIKADAVYEDKHGAKTNG